MVFSPRATPLTASVTALHERRRRRGVQPARAFRAVTIGGATKKRRRPGDDAGCSDGTGRREAA